MSWTSTIFGTIKVVSSVQVGMCGTSKFHKQFGRISLLHQSMAPVSEKKPAICDKTCVWLVRPVFTSEHIASGSWNPKKSPGKDKNHLIYLFHSFFIISFLMVPKRVCVCVDCVCVVFTCRARVVRAYLSSVLFLSWACEKLRILKGCAKLSAISTYLS